MIEMTHRDELIVTIIAMNEAGYDMETIATKLRKAGEPNSIAHLVGCVLGHHVTLELQKRGLIPEEVRP